MQSRIVSNLALAALISPQSLRRMALTQYAAHIDGISGKVGNAVFSKARGGTTMRKRVVPHNPRTANQQLARLDLSKSSKAFSALTAPQRAAWDSYAASTTATNRLTGAKFTLSAVSAFTKLSSKFLQVTPAGVIPLVPPASTFAGDTITITAVGSVGLAQITASGANAANVTTEILAVKVQSINRRPSLPAYRHKMFHIFVAGTLEQDLPLAKGTYEIAYSFVNVLTGEHTQVQSLGFVTIT